jgi:hypothetical protein
VYVQPQSHQLSGAHHFPLQNCAAARYIENQRDPAIYQNGGTRNPRHILEQVCQRLDNRLNCAVGNIDRQTGPLGPVLHNNNVLAGSPRAVQNDPAIAAKFDDASA